MTQFKGMSLEQVENMSYEKFVMMLNTTPMPDFDESDSTTNKNNSDSKGPITGKTTMMDYFKR